MIYYVSECQTYLDTRRHAGPKARKDLEEIFGECGYQRLVLSDSEVERDNLNYAQKLLMHVKIMGMWRKATAGLKKGDTLVIQFPSAGHSILLFTLLRKLRRKGVDIVFIIHDLEMLRRSQRKDVKKIVKIRTDLEDKECLKQATKIIAHNDYMSRRLIREQIDSDKLISLEIFDYLVDDFDQERFDAKVLGKDLPVIIAGNLKPHKAAYVYKLDGIYPFNLFGNGYEGGTSEYIRYLGERDAEELPYELTGSFGLVWDGETTDTCSGVYGSYLKINNPHKTSLYLASGIPIIIWKKAALARFVRKYRCV